MKSLFLMRTVFVYLIVFFSYSLAMAQDLSIPDKLQSVLDKAVDRKKIFGTSFSVKSDQIHWQGASGELTVDSPYFIASTTKLFTTALILHFQSQGLLDWNDPIERYLDSVTMKNLHVWKGTDYSKNITIQQLLAHTSGLPDYLQDKNPTHAALSDEIFGGKDQGWAFEEAIARSKTMHPKFIPGTKNKAHYADTNFQLLGKIIENITGKTYNEVCDSIILAALGLKNTYLYSNPLDSIPALLRYKKELLNIPKAMTSFGADGGMVSTSSDMLVFLEAFFSGQWFPSSYFVEMYVWNSVFYPVKSGIGIHLFKLPWLFNPTGKIPYFIGHSGMSGALAYYSPEKNLYITGTVNQIAHPDMSFRTMIKLANTVVSNHEK